MKNTTISSPPVQHRYDPPEAQDLWRRWQAGQSDELRHAIAAMHFGIVLKEAEYAARYDGRCPDDYVGYLTDKLYAAIEKFDPTRPEPFSGYAKACVKNGLITFRRTRRLWEGRFSSLNRPAGNGEDGDAEVGDLIADARPGDVGSVELWDAFDRVTAPLDRWARTLVRLNIIEGRTFTEIAASYGRTIERVSNDFAAAMTVIRERFTYDELLDILGDRADAEVTRAA